jgi:ABC-2 type transport system ATP-binding protein
MTDPIISLHALGKSYGAVRALDEITLDIPPGPVGLLGPNGAGKTTLIGLLLGLLVPESGSARISGLDPSRRADRLAVRRVVGYMPEGDCLIPGMNGVELVSTLGRLTGMTRRDALTRAHETLDYVGIEEARYRDLEQYSTGMKQRLKLAQALVHDPELLLLDEPTNGLDPQGRRHMLDLVNDLGQEHGKNILLSSHLLPDVEATCREVVVIHQGRVLETGSIAELTRSEELWMEVEIGGEIDRFAEALVSKGIEAERSTASRLRLRMREEDGDELFAIADRAGAVLLGLRTQSTSLEDAFLRALEEAREG